MSERRLETVVLGLNGAGRVLLEAASRVPDMRILAVADRDAGLAERFAGEYRTEGYDDYRQLITAMDAGPEDDVDRCLLVAEGLHNCGEYVRMAMKKRFNVLKMAPAARSFEEAAELVRLADEEGVTFEIANPMRFAGSFAALHDFVQEGRIENVFLVAAFCSFAGESFESWQSDPKLAGGGVLLHGSYGMVDQIMWNFPLPQEVYSLTTNQAVDKQQRLSLTEDTAVISMRFSDRFVGNFIASSRSCVWPRQEFVKVCGKDKILVVNDVRLTVRDAQGLISEEIEYENDRVDCMTGVVKNFALGVLGAEESGPGSSGRENLKNMAVIESAYLSGRTGMPEEPGKILQMAQFKPTDIQGDFK